MDVAFKFKGYRVLLIHNQDDYWDEIHLKLIDTDCTLFAVNSVKDASSLIALIPFDIIIGDADISDFNGTSLMHSVNMAKPNAVKIIHYGNANDDIRWHLILDGSETLDQKYLEMYGMLSILSDQTQGREEPQRQHIGRMLEERRAEKNVSLH